MRRTRLCPLCLEPAHVIKKPAMAPIILRVDNRIRIPHQGVSPAVQKLLRESCEHENPEFKKKRAMGYATYDTPAIIRTWKNEPDELTLPRGAMSRVREVLREQRVPFGVKDHRSNGALNFTPLKYVGHAPRPYQLDASKKCYQLEQGIVRAATGSGKT